MTTDKILKQALQLPKKERAELAHKLIDSLKPEKKYPSEEEWSKELKRRINQFEQGKSSTKTWSEIKENL